MINVIIFGEAGVGKSSVINLIAGREVVEISPDPSGITMASKAYDFTVDNKGIRIWDTVGLEDPQTGFSSLGDFAIKEAHQLISSLSEAGGVRLLLLCTRGDIPRAATMQRNYRLFNEFFCEKKVPIALVITHLEREMYMENWWGRNGRTLEIYGMHNIGHACITGLPGHRHYATSRQEIRKLLMDCALEDSASLLESQNPLAMMGRRIMGLVGVGSNPSRKDIERALKKRCGLDPRIAGEVAELMMASEKQSYTSTREIAVTMLMTPREEDTRSPAPAPFKGPWLKLVKAIRDVDGPGFSPPANQTKFRSSPPLVAPQSNTVEPPLGVNTAEPMQSQASHASGSDSSSLYPSSKLVELPRDVNPGPVDPLQIPHPPSHLLPPPDDR
ncbi:hypothetical protein BDN67DRAFT_797604 [Paxillus ammoniavirescens]|nr:hypothetical protein BDN67DRAFT_797604 [Paxillus ammoniavirescens]